MIAKRFQRSSRGFLHYVSRRFAVGTTFGSPHGERIRMSWWLIVTCPNLGIVVDFNDRRSGKILELTCLPPDHICYRVLSNATQSFDTTAQMAAAWLACDPRFLRLPRDHFLAIGACRALWSAVHRPHVTIRDSLNFQVYCRTHTYYLVRASGRTSIYRHGPRRIMTRSRIAFFLPATRLCESSEA